MPEKPLPRVEKANSLDDATYESSFLPDLDLNSPGLMLEFASAAELSQRQQQQGKSGSDLEACFQLLKSTSIDDYKASTLGWSTAGKREEMLFPDMRYIIVRGKQDKSVQGFISFMITYEDGYEIVYIYEIHLIEALRGQHIGSKLVTIVEEAGRRAEMSKVMLTVFARNHVGSRFYERIGYSLDAYSPEPRVLRGGVVKEPDYRILSKALDKQRRQTLPL